jgi:hypothetical protein
MKYLKLILMLRLVANILKRPEYAGKLLIPAAPDLLAIARAPYNMLLPKQDYAMHHGTGIMLETAIDKTSGETGEKQLKRAYEKILRYHKNMDEIPSPRAARLTSMFYMHYLPAYFYNIHNIVSYSGPYMEFYPNGNVKVQGYYTRGLRSGYWTSFYQDGSKEWEGIYVKGSKVGHWVGWKRACGSMPIRPVIIDYAQ